MIPSRTHQYRRRKGGIIMNLLVTLIFALCTEDGLEKEYETAYVRINTSWSNFSRDLNTIIGNERRRIEQSMYVRFKTYRVILKSHSITYTY